MSTSTIAKLSQLRTHYLKNFNDKENFVKIDNFNLGFLCEEIDALKRHIALLENRIVNLQAKQ